MLLSFQLQHGSLAVPDKELVAVCAICTGKGCIPVMMQETACITFQVWCSS